MIDANPLPTLVRVSLRILIESSRICLKARDGGLLLAIAVRHTQSYFDEAKRLSAHLARTLMGREQNPVLLEVDKFHVLHYLFLSIA